MKLIQKKTLSIIILIILIVSLLLFTGCIYKVPKDPNTFNRTINHDGLIRTYLIHIPSLIPKNYSPPLVFVLHGGGGTGDGMERTLTLGGFNKLSDKYNFIVVYPDGIDRHWNDGRKNVSDRAHQENIDDVGFFETLIANLTFEFNIDPNRIYATGISNGAMMSYRLAFDIPEKIAAIAPVAGAIPIDLLTDNLSSEPVSVCVISGTHDPLVPWEGGPVGFPRNPRGIVISVPDSVKHWVNYNNCDTTPNSTWLEDINKRDRTKVRIDIYNNGKNNTEVFLYEIKKGGHTWPDGYQYLPRIIIGRTCRDINANIVIWDFFNTHPKN